MDQPVNNKEVTMTELAGMVKRGFDEVHEQLGQLQRGQETLECGQQALERGQEDIKLRLSNVAYRFEFEQLEKRVVTIEHKVGIAAG